MLTNKDLIEIGFTELSHFNIGNSVNFYLDETRFLTCSGVGTFNEFMYIGELTEKNSEEISDLIKIHNYDLDGYLTLEKVKGIIKYLTIKNK